MQTDVVGGRSDLDLVQQLTDLGFVARGHVAHGLEAVQHVGDFLVLAGIGRDRFDLHVQDFIGIIEGQDEGLERGQRAQHRRRLDHLLDVFGLEGEDAPSHGVLVDALDLGHEVDVGRGVLGLLLQDVDDGLDFLFRPDGDVGGVQERAHHGLPGGGGFGRLFGLFRGFLLLPGILLLGLFGLLGRRVFLFAFGDEDRGHALIDAFRELGVFGLHVGQQRVLVVLDVQDAHAGHLGSAQAADHADGQEIDVFLGIEAQLLDGLLVLGGVLAFLEGL